MVDLLGQPGWLSSIVGFILSVSVNHAIIKERLQEKTMDNVPGNHYDKHNSKNPVYRSLMKGFHDKIISTIKDTRATTILDVGCGEGYTTKEINDNYLCVITGIDVSKTIIRKAKELHPEIAFTVGSAYRLPYPDNSYDLVIATEMLEHLQSPETAIIEMKRVSKKYVMITVPNEPLWRIGNMARGAYIDSWGNTPGHLQHWSKKGIFKLMKNYFEDGMIKNAIMWNIGLFNK
jgi:ubiquinone/menaquinone biosynthesis C-methylase UbiE